MNARRSISWVASLAFIAAVVLAPGQAPQPASAASKAGITAGSADSVSLSGPATGLVNTDSIAKIWIIL